MSPTSRSKEEAVQVLMNLGLTPTQAKAYLTLCRLGRSTTKTISTESRIARQDIYRTLAELQESGLVNKTITRPVMFEAVPIQDAIDGLMERRAKKTRELQKGTKRLLLNFRENNKRCAANNEEQQFVMVPKGEAGILKRRKAIESAQKSIDVVNSWKRFPKTVLTYAGETKKALQRGVELRVITEKPGNAKSIPKEILEFQEIGAFRIKYITDPPPAVISIYDKKEILVATLSSTGLDHSPTLWTNNPSMIAVVRDYFEIMWITAMEEDPKVFKKKIHAQS
jgi:sugar-specific transcriptional regulator TrmB